MRRMPVLVSLILFFTHLASQAEAGIALEGRLMGGVVNSNPTNLNTEMTSQGITNFKSLLKGDVDGVYPVASFLGLGLRYEKVYSSQGLASGAASSYLATIDEDIWQLIARVPIIKKSFFRFDIFGAYGGGNMTFTDQTATQNGWLTRRTGSDFFNKAVSSYGASVGVGFKGYFLTVEGGYTNNKMDNFKSTGNMNSNISVIDLSGPYFTIGLTVDAAQLTSLTKK